MEDKEGRFAVSNLFGNGRKPPPPQDGDDADLGPCASIPRGKWVTALEVRSPAHPWRAYLYRDLGTVSEYSPGEFTVVFEGREQRHKLRVKGRNLHGIYLTIVQGRLEWVQPVDRDFSEDGQPVITGVDVVVEKVER